jgi:hypothetical protein
MPVLNTDTYIDLIERCERHYNAQGFVKWSDLATELGVSRQLVLQKLQRAVCHGLISSADLDRYRSTAVRNTLGRTNEDIRRANDRLRVQLALTPDNHQWLRAQVQSRPGVTTADLINGFITRARESAFRPPFTCLYHYATHHLDLPGPLLLRARSRRRPPACSHVRPSQRS